jgi:siderophore synthetase component
MSSIQSYSKTENIYELALIADRAEADARKRAMQRMVQALFREHLLIREHLIYEGSVSWLPLWSQQAVLRFEGLQIGRIENCRLFGPVSYYRVGERPQAIHSPSALLSCVLPSLQGVTSGADVQRLVRELDNSLENDTLCLGYRRGWAQQLINEFGTGQPNFIAALRNAGLHNPALLLEQWGTLGHPWHPNYKTKIGLTTDQVIAMSPEFKPALQVGIAAIRSKKVHVEFAGEGDDYRAWFARSYPAVWDRWTSSLAQNGYDATDWLPLPLHPYQAQYSIPQKFAEEIAGGELLLLPDAHMSAAPTMSFRTVVPEGSPAMPHMKLPVSLRLTSVQRTVSPKSAVMGPRLTRLLNTIISHEQGFDETLAIVPENVGIHYIDPEGDDERSRHLAVLYRGNPMAEQTDDLFPVPVGSLFAESPLSERPLVTDLVSVSYGDHAQGAISFFYSYVGTVLNATLSPYLLYGIAFEGHQQNSFILIDREHKPVKLLARDFGDLRIHAPTLAAAGLELNCYRKGYTLLEDAKRVRDKFLHAVMLCHLAELGLLLSRTYNEPEGSFWNALRHQTQEVFERLKSRTNPIRWHEERHALLEADWPAKYFLRMRLLDTSDDVHGTMRNPLQDTQQ